MYASIFSRPSLSHIIFRATLTRREDRKRLAAGEAEKAELRGLYGAGFQLAANQDHSDIAVFYETMHLCAVASRHADGGDVRAIKLLLGDGEVAHSYHAIVYVRLESSALAQEKGYVEFLTLAQADVEEGGEKAKLDLRPSGTTIYYPFCGKPQQGTLGSNVSRAR